MKKNSLNKQDRGVSHFLNLKKDYSSDQERLAISLPLFYRIMFLDQPNPWVKEINRFGFVKLASVDLEFGNQKYTIGEEVYYCSKINRSQMEFHEIKLDLFFERTIITIQNETYSIHEFILGVAYNGGLHMHPDKTKSDKYNLLYENFLNPHSEISIDIITQISKILIDIFEEFYSLLIGNNDGHASNINYQPQIVSNGQILEGIYFNKAIMQFPVREKKKKGIRICLEIKLIKVDNTKNHSILEYGHIDDKKAKIQLYYNNKFLFINVASTTNTKQLKIELNEDFYSKFIQLELAVYPNGKIIVAINGRAIISENLDDNFEIIDGKIILGSNLTCTIFGSFYEQTITVQSIDKNDDMLFLGVYSLRLLKQENLQNIGEQLVQREFL